MSQSTAVLGSGSGNLPPGPMNQDLFGHPGDLGQFQDISDYGRVTTYVSVTGGLRDIALSAFTASTEAAFLVATTQPSEDPWTATGGNIIQTLDPAPPNLALQIVNFNPETPATFNWMVVGRPI